MPSRAALTVLALFACSSGPAASDASPAPRVAPSASAQRPTHWAGLEPGRHVAVPITRGIPAELGDVQLKFAQAAALNQEWLMNYAEELQLPPGAPLPYHPKLGISEDEYKRLQHAYEHPVIGEGERRDVDVRLEGDALRFSAPAPLTPLERLEIDASGRVRYGDIVVDRPEIVDGLTGKFGTWSGFSWRHDRSNIAEKQLDTFALELGQVGSRRFLHLDRWRLDGAAVTESTDLLVWLE